MPIAKIIERANGKKQEGGQVGVEKSIRSASFFLSD